MKRTSSNTSPRNSISTAYAQAIDKENIQPNSSINEHCSTNQPQIVQRSQVDKSHLFPTASESEHQLEATNLRLINSITKNINPPLLTDDLYAQLVEPLSNQDFETAMRIAGVSSLQELYELACPHKRSLLIFAAAGGHTKVINALLSKLKNPDSFACMKDNFGHTALMFAAVSNQPESIKTLLNIVKDPETLASMTDEVGMSALMLAAFRGYAESVTALLTSVRNGKQLVLMKNQSDFNALMLAAIYNQTDSIQAILDNVKNPEELVYFPNNDGKTALMICSRNESDFEFNPNGLIMMLETVKKIRDPDSLIFLTDINGMNAFMIAAEENNDLAVATLFHWTTDKLALLKQEDKKQRTAVDLLDPVLCDGLIRLLVKKVMPIDSQDLDAVLSLLQQKTRLH